MKFTFSSGELFSVQSPAIVIFAFENERLKLPPAAGRLLRSVSNEEFSGKSNQVLLLHTGGNLAAKRLVLVGFGEKKSCGPEIVRRGAGHLTKTLRRAGIDRAVLQVRDGNHLGPIIEGVLLADYQFTRFKDQPEQRTVLTSLTLGLPAKSDIRDAKRRVEQARISAESANYAREISNLPGNIVYPEMLAGYARQLARDVGLKCRVLDRRALKRDGFGGILAVGGGSRRDPRLIILEHKPARPTNRKPIALVGKALTFDSGGISIKPSDKMDEMKFDKCGGVAVLGAMRAIALAKLPLHVIGIIASAENMPSDRSYRPGDIVTSYRGKDRRGITIEVLNTDAEGRIVLGDALVHARERGAEAIIDLATLTGACVVALGDIAAGLMGNDEGLQTKIRRAGERSGERVWPLPMWEEYKEKIKSHVADHKNTGGRYGGAITAAIFLQRYVGDTPWAHLDIAGTAWTTNDLPYFEKGATGFGVRLLVDLLTNWNA